MSTPANKTTRGSKKLAARRPPRGPLPLGANGPAKLATDYGLSRSAVARALGVSEATLTEWESGALEIPLDTQARMGRVQKVLGELAQVMKRSFIPTWLETPNPACEGRTPLDHLGEGRFEVIQDVIYHLGAGEPI